MGSFTGDAFFGEFLWEGGEERVCAGRAGDSTRGRGSCSSGGMTRLSYVLWVVLGAVLGGCEVAAPELVEVAWPSDTRDPSGPYAVMVVARGAVDGASLRWSVGERGGEVALGRAGAGWVGAVPGQAVGSVVELALVVRGPGGAVGAEGGFAVLDPSGRCLVDGDCLGGEICRGRQCGPRPAVCADDEDCPQDRFCAVAGEPCRFRPTGCAVDEDCAAGFGCVGGQCVAPARCVDDAECPEGRCLRPPGRCAGPEACFEDAQCGAGEVCRDGRCELGVEVPCPGGCPAGQVCLPSEARCVECTADGQCGAGRYCDLTGYRCAAGARGRPCVPCGPGLECGGGYGCPADLGGVCLPLCGAGCPAGTVCQGEVCAPDAPRFCSGTGCAVDGDCEGGVCRSGYCEARQACAADADCAAGWSCTDARCVPDAPGCRNPGDCPRGMVCLGGRCAMGRPAGVCARCTFNEECQSGLCIDFDRGERRCAVACGGDDCPDGTRCQSVDEGVALCLGVEGGCPAPVCGVDRWEPNDTAESATGLRVGGGAQASTCAGDADWFGLVDVAPGLLRVQTQGVLGVAVLDAQRAPLRGARVPAGGGVELVVSADAWFVRVEGEAAGEAAYTLELVERVLECEDDRFEENDAREAATLVGWGADVRGVACPGDVDWFRVRTRGEVGVAVVSPLGGGTVAVGAFAESWGMEQVVSAEPVVVPLPDAEAVWLTVECEGCAAGQAYRLETRLGAE